MNLSDLMNGCRHAVSIIWKLEARLRGVRMGGPVRFLGRPIIAVFPGSNITLEGENSFMSSPRCNPLGNAVPCVLRTMTATARIRVGRNVGMSSASICATVSVEVGDGTIIGAGAMIFDTDFHERIGEFEWGGITPRICKPISIGRGCFLGTRCIVMKGVTIGDGAVIGAGAVITKDVPAGATAVGNPMRIIPADPN